MEKSQEQWKALSLHNSCKYVPTTHYPPPLFSASLLSWSCIIVICWLLLCLGVHHSLSRQLHLLSTDKLLIGATVAVCNAAEKEY